VLCGTIALALAPVEAHAAGRGPGGGARGDTGGNSDNQEISASAGAVTYDESKNGSGKSTGSITPVGNWSPPPCWYAPTWSPEEFKAYIEPIWGADSTGSEWDNTQRDRYVNGNPYTNFNLDKSGKGYWWTSFVPQGGAAVPGALDCTEPYFWVDKGQAPPADIKNAITPQILAELAYDRVRVPDTEINLSPTNKQTVNLATWAWLDKATFKPVSVTASVNLLNISATTTATPIALHIDPGTPDADVYPASGDCAINKDGSIGTAYATGDENKTPPCGLTYRRSSSSNGGTFPLKATITWKVSWTGSGGTGGNLPDGTFGNTTNVTVQEIQTVNR
jgi:enoyl reductase